MSKEFRFISNDGSEAAKRLEKVIAELTKKHGANIVRLGASMHNIRSLARGMQESHDHAQRALFYHLLGVEIANSFGFWCTFFGIDSDQVIGVSEELERFERALETAERMDATEQRLTEGGMADAQAALAKAAGK